MDRSATASMQPPHVLLRAPPELVAGVGLNGRTHVFSNGMKHRFKWV